MHGVLELVLAARYQYGLVKEDLSVLKPCRSDATATYGRLRVPRTERGERSRVVGVSRDVGKEPFEERVVVVGEGALEELRLGRVHERVRRREVRREAVEVLEHDEPVRVVRKVLPRQLLT